MAPPKDAAGGRLFRAALLWTGEGEPIADAALAVSGGRVAAVGGYREVRARHPGWPEREPGDVLVLPGLVNAHTHLELTHLRTRRAPFPEWLPQVVEGTRAWGPADFGRSAAAGAFLALKGGTTCVGDVSASGEGARALKAVGLRGVAFFEVLGGFQGDAEEQLRKRLPPPDLARESCGPLVRPGASPHAPYSTSEELYRLALEEAGRRGWPAATHIAETQGEEALLRSGAGPLREPLRRLGMPEEGLRPRGLSPLAWLDGTGLGPRFVLLFHCNYIEEGDFERLRRWGTSVCYCPRAHAYFGHRDHPWLRLREVGVNVCLGTDSLASNESLSPLDELRFLRERHPEVRAKELLGLATTAGARALDLEGEGVGRLVPGGVADFIALRAAGGRGAPRTLEEVLGPGLEVALVAVGGEALYDSYR